MKKSIPRYQFGVCKKVGVPEYLPRLPQPAVFNHGEEFREYLLCKCKETALFCFYSLL